MYQGTEPNIPTRTERTMTTFAARIDGREASAAELAPLAFAGYAHFTAAQIRGGLVRGLDLHLDRLRSASVKLFGKAVPAERVRELVRDARALGPADASLTVTMFSSAGEFTASKDAEPSVLVRTGP